MKENLYLIFSLNNSLYGISDVYVEEFFSLPELTPILESSHDLVGVVNLRGDILPVVALNLSLGYPSSDYRLTDSVVVLGWEEMRVGIIVNEVHELKNISPQEIIAKLSAERQVAGDELKKSLVGIAKSAGDILILSHPENWLQYAKLQQVKFVKDSLKQEIQESFIADEFQVNGSALLLPQPTIFCPKATPEERSIFRERADNLKQSAEIQDLSDLRPIAVIALKGKFFGVDLAMVREFTNIRNVTPVPCCPVHIIGNMNLRGEILTLVDICGLLNLPLTGLPEGSKAMIVDVEGIVVGVMVEEICDVMFLLNPLEIRAVPPAIHSINDEYLQGVAPYAEKMMNILDLPKILLNSGLIVDEAI